MNEKRYAVLRMTEDGLHGAMYDLTNDQARDLVEEWTASNPDGPTSSIDCAAVSDGAGGYLPGTTLTPGSPRWALIVDMAPPFCR